MSGRGGKGDGASGKRPDVGELAADVERVPGPGLGKDRAVRLIEVAANGLRERDRGAAGEDRQGCAECEQGRGEDRRRGASRGAGASHASGVTIHTTREGKEHQ